VTDMIKRALTRKRVHRGRVVHEEPNEKLVLGVKFAIGMTAILSALEIAHMAFLGSWNSEIFAAITGLTGTIVGLFVGQKT
jgi:carbonic anhydrase/acetyltransferase-like protein (isoleucine patch superfamily)